MQSGVVEGKKWLTAIDERTCDPCTDMDNMTAPLGQPTWEKEGLDIGDVQGEYGLDFDYTEGEMPHPPLHPRCRCTITPIVKVITKPLLENLRISDASLEQLQGEAKLNGMMFDQRSTLESAAMTKERITKELAEKLKDSKDFTEYLERKLHGFLTGTPEWNAERIVLERQNVIRDLIQTWAGTSGDESARAIAMQMAARKEFGLTNATLKHFGGSALEEAKIMFARDGKAFQAFLRAQYNLTQEFFTKNGITELTGYRGIGWGIGNKPAGYDFYGEALKIKSSKLQLQSLSSFSTDPKVAKEFLSGNYSMMSQTEIPINRILSTCQTGFGCKGEVEFVVLGGIDDYKIITSSNFYLHTESEILKAFADFKVAPKP